MSLQLFNGANIAKAVQANDLIVVEAATINVKDLDGVLVPLFEDKAGLTPQINPFITDSTGSFKFYVQPGEYNLTVVKVGVSGEIFIELGAGGEVTLVNIETNALTVGADNHGTLYNISDLTGSVSVTLTPVGESSVGDIVFFSSNTDSDIQLVPDVGVTIQTPSSLIVDRKFSSIAAIVIDENIWRIMGDMAP